MQRDPRYFYERPSRWVSVRGFLAEFVTFVLTIAAILAVFVAASVR